MIFPNPHFERRRCLSLCSMFTILVALGRLPVGASAPVPKAIGDGFVLVDGWVLPARYFQG